MDGDDVLARSRRGVAGLGEVVLAATVLSGEGVGLLFERSISRQGCGVAPPSPPLMGRDVGGKVLGWGVDECHSWVASGWDFASWGTRERQSRDRDQSPRRG